MITGRFRKESKRATKSDESDEKLAKVGKQQQQ